MFKNLGGLDVASDRVSCLDDAACEDGFIMGRAMSSSSPVSGGCEVDSWINVSREVVTCTLPEAMFTIVLLGT